MISYQSLLLSTIILNDKEISTCLISYCMARNFRGTKFSRISSI